MCACQHLQTKSKTYKDTYTENNLKENFPDIWKEQNDCLQDNVTEPHHSEAVKQWPAVVCSKELEGILPDLFPVMMSYSVVDWIPNMASEKDPCNFSQRCLYSKEEDDEDSPAPCWQLFGTTSVEEDTQMAAIWKQQRGSLKSFLAVAGSTDDSKVDIQYTFVVEIYLQFCSKLWVDSCLWRGTISPVMPVRYNTERPSK